MTLRRVRNERRRLVALIALVVISTWGSGAFAAGRVSPSDIGTGGDVVRLSKAAPERLQTGPIYNTTTGFSYASIAAAVADAATGSGDVIEVQVASHSEGLVLVDESVTIQSSVGGSTILATTDTGTSGDARGWFLITAPGVTFKDLDFDAQSGAGRSIYQCLRFRASGGVVQDCSFANVIGLPTGSYDGRGIALFDASATITGCSFSNIRRIGIHIFGPPTAGTTVSGCTYTGKGAGDQLDYGIELGGGAVATLSNNTITACEGVASVDGSTSAAVLITDYFAPGTSGTLNGNFLNGNTLGVAVGYLATDVSVAVIQGNDLSGNASGGVGNTNASRDIDASANWWGSNVAATVAASAGTAVDYTPWLDVGTDTSGSVGFQGSYSTLHVDDDSPQVGATGRVQEGVDLVTASTVVLLPGTYEEQVVITTNGLTLDGAGPGSTTIQSPPTLAASFSTGPNNFPVVFVNGATGVTVQDLTIDGLGRGNANYRFQGLAYWNGGGTARNLHVTGIRETPLSGSQHGVGIYAYNNTGGPYSLEVDACLVDDCQKNAMALSGTGLTVDVHDCTTVGSGPTALIAQNGIQVSYGAGGTVEDCAISDVDYTPSTWVSSGLLTYQATTVAVSGLSGANAIVDAQAPVSWYDTNGSMDDLETTGGAQFGPVFIGNFTTSKAGPVSRGAQRAALVSPYEDGGAFKAARTSASFTVTLSNACLAGTNASGSVGVYAYSAGQPLDVTVTNCNVDDWDYGLLADGAAATLTANTNHVTGNTTAGYDNTASLAAQDAEGNWWGDATGPSGLGSGTGDAVLGAGVDFSPWRTNGIDAGAACGFQPSDNLVGPVPPSGCLSIADTCVTVPFDIARVDAVPMRGFSVTFALSPELMLCSGTASITQGTYLNGIGATNFQVLDNGGGSYTVDCAILGIPCGATAATGTLFQIAVKKAGPDGTGTITPLFVTLRDCSNATVAGAPGAAATITIDTVAPAAIALTAVQDKTANGTDGTTFIDVTVPAVAATDVVRVYRKGFGNYPEYDDAPGAGSVPALPATEAAATGGGWTLAFTVPGPAGATYAHEPLARDFWYFVAFVEDACGNVGGATSMTAGKLNYHLGDVHNGASNCAGDNSVGTSDLSFLGANYGATLGASDPLGCLDVGPTTDYSVDARPTTDNRLQFEDLMMFAINHGQVSKTGPALLPARSDALFLVVDTTSEDVLEAELWLRGAGRVQGLSARLAWNATVVEPAGVAAAELLSHQGGVAWSAEPGVVDVALLGARDLGLAGEGVLARLRFQRLAAGEADIRLVAVDARDAGNRRIDLESGSSDPAGTAPRVTSLQGGVPNPFNPTTTVGFTLAVRSDVEISIHDAAGRRVRVLVREARDAGRHAVVWDGTDAAGRRVASGTYYLRMTTPEGRWSRTLTLVK